MTDRVRGGVQLLLGLSCFLATSGVVRAYLPDPELVASTPKFEYFAQHAAEFDAVFLGSSRVYRHFVPEVIDARLAELGTPLRTFNFGVPGAGAFEVDHLLRRILNLEQAQLSYVFVEPSAWSPTIFSENRETERTVAWHTTIETRQALSVCWNRRAPVREKVELAAMHVRLCAWWLSNLGQGSRFYRAVAGRQKQHTLTAGEVKIGHGYRALESEDGEAYHRRRKELLDRRTEFESKITRLPLGEKPGRHGSQAGVSLIKKQADLVREAGAKLVYVIPPGTAATPDPYLQRRDGKLGVLLAFNDPSQFSSYYEYDSFFDLNHLTSAGARMFSARFAEVLVAWLDGKIPPGFVRQRR